MSTKSTLLGILEAILQTEERNKHSLEIIERRQIKLYFIEAQNSKKETIISTYFSIITLSINDPNSLI